MQIARLPENEAARVATLHSMNILDTPREDRFDRYTRITARIFDMPIALISLVDKYRQWFKSAEGLEADETPRDISFCGHAILGDGVFEVRNTRRDPRFRDNPLVIEQPHIRFYAGAPLETPNGHKLGTLCIIDRVPRHLTDDEKTMLKNLADMVVGEMMSKIDTETGLANREEQILNGTKLIDDAEGERDFSLLLFDISETFARQDGSDSQVPPGVVFAKLLQCHFPMAKSIAHMGGYHFCVMLTEDRSFDERLAINRLCEDTRKSLCGDGDPNTLPVYVGGIEYDPDKHISIDDMLCEADAMFYGRGKKPAMEPPTPVPLADVFGKWRKTIF